jgi:hypothetical protein
VQQITEIHKIDKELLLKEAELLHWLIKTKSLTFEDDLGFFPSFCLPF